MSFDDMDKAIEILRETRAELRGWRADTCERLAPTSPRPGGRIDFSERVQAILRSTRADLFELAELAGKPPNN